MLGTGIEYYKSNYGGNSQEGEVSDTEGRGKEEFVNKLASGTANYSNYI